MSPDLAFGCAHERVELTAQFDGIRFRHVFKCLDCTTVLGEVIGPVLGRSDA